MKQSIGLEVLVNVVIPPGYILANYNDFEVNITLDESDLVTNIIMENYDCDEKGICTATRNFAILSGMLNYNVRVENLQPIRPIDSVVSSTTTQFSTAGFLQINKCLARSFNNEFISTDYWIHCKKGEEFITLTNGLRINRTNDYSLFMKMLNNPDQCKAVSIPYIITIFSRMPKE